MVWSVYKNSVEPDVTKWVENYSAWYYDYDIETNSPPNRVKFMVDGIHQIHYEFNGKLHKIDVEIKDGCFDKETIDEQINKMVSNAGYWGPYVELFYKQNGKLFVAMGS